MNRNSIVAIFLAVFVIVPVTWATPQRADEMTHKGEVMRIHGFRLSKRLETAMERHEKREGAHIMSTGNYDGIYADLKICGGRLFITKFGTDLERVQREHGWHPSATPYRIHLWPWGRSARWFTGTLYEDHSIYPSAKSARYRVFHFRRGRLIRVEERTS